MNDTTMEALSDELAKTGVFEWKQTVTDTLPCDTYECADRLWCIQRSMCKRDLT